jgi:hypothetical protein
MGNYREIHGHNRAYTPYYNNHVFSFVRYSDDEKLIIVCNFHAYDTFGFDLQIPPYLIEIWGLTDGEYSLTDQLFQKVTTKLYVNNGLGKTRVTLAALESFILRIE